MNIAGVGKRVRVYVGESDLHHGRPLFLVMLETLRAEGCAGATVLRGIAGFGANSRIHTATILRLSEDLPVVIDWVDNPDRVRRVLPRIQELVGSGLITMEDVEIVHYQHRPVADIGSRLRVREVMTRDVQTVHPETPLRAVVELLIDRDYRALPVVDAERHLAGLVTGGDLVERSGLGTRIQILEALTPESMAQQLEQIEKDKTVADVMTPTVTTISPEATLDEAAHSMVTHRLKRLPVVDPSGVLLGIISRVDLLRSSAEAYPQPAEEAPRTTGQTVGEVMRTDLPTVQASTPLPELLDTVISTPLNRAIVLDSERRVLGVVTDAELVRRLSPKDRPGMAHMLMSRLPTSGLPPERRRELDRMVGKTAEQLMVPDVSTVSANSSIAEAIRVMLRDRRQILPVVDGEGHLLGAVSRADLLRTLVR